MNHPTPDTLHRTLKLELDDGRADTVEEAQRIVDGYRLQIDVGDAVAQSGTWQAALLTAVATGSRAFPGGVFVRSADNPTMSVAWAKGQRLHDAVRHHGGQMVTDLLDTVPVLRIAAPLEPPEIRHPVDLTLTWHGWAAGLVPTGEQRLAETTEFPLSGITAASLAVGELLQHVRGDTRTGHRTLGVSLWNPATPWQAPAAAGQACDILPTKLWLIGLGHLGQAYGWAIGMLPYANPAEVILTLQDTDHVVEANISTGVLSRIDDLGTPKTRVTAAGLEALGFRTRITERTFDEYTRPHDDDPIWALGGLDNRQARRWAATAGFGRYVDAGIGDTTHTYLDVLIQTFPSTQDLEDAFPQPTPTARATITPAYEKLIEQQIRAGTAEGHARCGVMTIMDRAVGASFVGTTTASLVLAQLLRELNTGEPALEVIGFNLRAPEHTDVAPSSAPVRTNPGYTTALLPSSAKQRAPAPTPVASTPVWRGPGVHTDR